MDELERIDARRICIIKPSAMGDVVQAMPLLGALRNRFGAARIAWVVNRELAGLLEGHPALDELLLFDRRGSWGAALRLLAQLRSRRFDLVLDLQGLLRTAVMTWATGARRRIGLETAREGSAWACHRLISETGRDVPAELRYWRVAEAFGVGGLPRRAEFQIPEAALRWAAEAIPPRSAGWLAVHPGAQWTTKRWPVERFAAAAADHAGRTGCGICIVGAPGEAALAERLARALPHHVEVKNLCGKTDLKQLAAVLQRAVQLLCNDSGPMHLAAALGTPTTAVFTATDPLRSGPGGARHRQVWTLADCRGCYCKSCPKTGPDRLRCLRELPVSFVVAALGEAAGGPAGEAVGGQAAS
jgi:lipopolysaccharide heptosyltransferase II